MLITVSVKCQQNPTENTIVVHCSQNLESRVRGEWSRLLAMDFSGQGFQS